MSKITKVELFHVRVPLDKPFYPSWVPGYPQTENRFDLLKVTTEDGIVGYSAGPAISTERSGLGELIAPYLIGNDATDIKLMQQRLREISYLGIRCGWMEPAIWDIKGKIENKPVYELLGGENKPIHLYASTGEVKQPQARLEEAQARYDDGFKSIKLRIHDFDINKDIEQVKAVTDVLGDKMEIGVDANQAWRVTIINDAPLWDLERAKRFADASHDMGVSWIEEPLPMDEYDDLTALRNYSKVPISGGELHSSGYPELKMMIERGCYDIFQPDAIMSGGISQALAVAKLCREHGLKFTPHTWTTGIGFAVNMQVMLASGFSDEMHMEYPINPPSWIESKRDAILKTPYLHDKGMLHIDRAPGLGFEIDEKALKKYGKRFFSMGSTKLIFHTLKDKGLKTAREIDRNRKKYGVKNSA